MSEAEVDNMIVNSCESPSRGTMQQLIIASVWKRGEIPKDIFATDKHQQSQFGVTAGDASRMFNTEVSFPLDDEAAFEASINDQDCLGQLEDVDHLNWMKQLARVGIALLETPDFPLEKSIKPESSLRSTATESNQQDEQAHTVNSVNKENHSTANSQSTLRKQLEIATGVTKSTWREQLEYLARELGATE